MGQAVASLSLHCLWHHQDIQTGPSQCLQGKGSELCCPRKLRSLEKKGGRDKRSRRRNSRHSDILASFQLNCPCHRRWHPVLYLSEGHILLRRFRTHLLGKIRTINGPPELLVLLSALPCIISSFKFTPWNHRVFKSTRSHLKRFWYYYS